MWTYECSFETSGVEALPGIFSEPIFASQVDSHSTWHYRTSKKFKIINVLIVFITWFLEQRPDSDIRKVTP